MKVSFLSAAFALTLSLTNARAADDWPVYQHDVMHTGLSSAAVKPPQLQLIWTAPTGYATPLIVGRTVYATANGQGTGTPTTISSFDLRTGAIDWSYTGAFLFPSQAAYGGNFVVFIGSPSGGGASSLYVLNATSGALLYQVPVPEGPTAVVPTVAYEPSTGSYRAFCADGSSLTCVDLAATSGSVIWTQSGEFGGSSIPTIAANSVIMAGPGQYYAFDRLTGQANHFHAGDIEGGGGVATVFDTSRNQIYIVEDYNAEIFTALSAYSYVDNQHITLLWQRSDGIAYGGSVAIGSTGNVYVSASDGIRELNPASGATLRTIPGAFAAGMTPAITRNVLWAFTDSQTNAYSLADLHLLRAIEGSRGSLNSAYDSPGAFTQGTFILDYGTIYGSPGFGVYRQGR